MHREKAMDKPDSVCDEQLIYRYYDKDTDADENRRVEAHLLVCKQCRKQLELLQSGSDALAERIEDETRAADFFTLEKNVIHTIRDKNSSYFSWKELLFKKIYVPVTVAAAITLLISFYYFQMPIYSPPSAIINSFTGEFSSVMIFETPETKQTILWINEDEALNVENQPV